VRLKIPVVVALSIGYETELFAAHFVFEKLTILETNQIHNSAGVLAGSPADGISGNASSLTRIRQRIIGTSGTKERIDFFCRHEIGRGSHRSTALKTARGAAVAHGIHHGSRPVAQGPVSGVVVLTSATLPAAGFITMFRLSQE